MSLLKKILGRCRLEEETGCLIWTGAASAGQPRIYAPDPGKKGANTVQNGIRVVWQEHTGKAIPQGHRVYHAKCTNSLCLNKHHLACGPSGDWGEHIREKGHWKNAPARVLAGRAHGRKCSSVTPDAAMHILNSNDRGIDLARELQLSEKTISRVRHGKLKSVLCVDNPFAGLSI